MDLRINKRFPGTLPRRPDGYSPWLLLHTHRCNVYEIACKCATVSAVN